MGFRDMAQKEGQGKANPKRKQNECNAKTNRMQCDAKTNPARPEMAIVTAQDSPRPFALHLAMSLALKPIHISGYFRATGTFQCK